MNGTTGIVQIANMSHRKKKPPGYDVNADTARGAIDQAIFCWGQFSLPALGVAGQLTHYLPLVVGSV
jgi:hypothetical protein